MNLSLLSAPLTSYFARLPVPDADCRIGRDPDHDVFVGLHLDLPLLLGQLHLLRQRLPVPYLDGPVSESADDGVVAYLDVVDLVRALEGRFSRGRGQASVPAECWI